MSSVDSLTLAVGGTSAPNVTVLVDGEETTDVKFSWSGADESVVSVDADGTVFATGIGQTPATIVYSYVGGMLTGGAKALMIGLLCLFSLVILAGIVKQIYTEHQAKKAAKAHE